jgi:hypothetical protein
VLLLPCSVVGLFRFVWSGAMIAICKGNDPLHFENLHIAIMSLFRVATGDDWDDIMFTAQYGCDAFASPSPAECDNSAAMGVVPVLFFSIFQMLGGMVFLNLFTGVITAGMYDSMEEQAFEKTTEAMVEVVRLAGDMPHSCIKALFEGFNALDLSGTKELELEDLHFVVEDLLHLQFPEEALADIPHDLLHDGVACESEMHRRLSTEGVQEGRRASPVGSRPSPTGASRVGREGGTPTSARSSPTGFPEHTVPDALQAIWNDLRLVGVGGRALCILLLLPLLLLLLLLLLLRRRRRRLLLIPLPLQWRWRSRWRVLRSFAS